jgi:predicted nucleic acid-binding protein
VALTVAATDALIDFRAGRGAAVDVGPVRLAQGAVATTAISRFEILAGVGSARQERAVRRLLGALRTLPLDGAGADRAARIRRPLEREGQGIGMADGLIAGIVMAHDGNLLTRNRQHFARIEGLTLAEVVQK